MLINYIKICHIIIWITLFNFTYVSCLKNYCNFSALFGRRDLQIMYLTVFVCSYSFDQHKSNWLIFIILHKHFMLSVHKYIYICTHITRWTFHSSKIWFMRRIIIKVLSSGNFHLRLFLFWWILQINKRKYNNYILNLVLVF